jgi:hypothetical protein
MPSSESWRLEPRSMNRIVPAILATSLIAGATVTAQSVWVSRVQPPAPGARLIEPWKPADSDGATRIIGNVIDIRQVPVAYARVQLRNLTTAKIDDVKQADANGNYEFIVEMPGTYVVEMAALDGYVIALSNAGALARFETLRTVVQLPGRWDFSRGAMLAIQDMSSFFGMSAANSMTATTLSLAAEQSLNTIEAGEPVSP